VTSGDSTKSGGEVVGPDDLGPDPLAPYDYTLPDEAIARFPAAERAGARMMVLSGDGLHHDHVAGIGRWLRPGDVLVVNNTRVIPARLFARRATGGRVELLFLGIEPHRSGRWAMARPSRRLKVGEELEVVRRDGRLVPGLQVRLMDRGEDGAWRVEAAEDVLECAGEVPLPPYLGRAPVAADAERYQTVFAGPPGAVAAPTAGLHLTASLVAELEAAGVQVVQLTLHVGAGTFRNLRPEDVARGRLHAEAWELSEVAAERINAAKRAGGRVVAVGTTSTRTLESAATETGLVEPGRGATELFIRSGHRFRVVDGLLTNFHLPRTSLLMLVGALGGRERVMGAYRAAVRQGYRFFSYGDAMLVFPVSRAPSL
jgi:S-adenosylmethionine:tRNA ribosyltransferase-isomerase